MLTLDRPRNDRHQTASGDLPALKLHALGDQYSQQENRLAAMHYRQPLEAIRCYDCGKGRVLVIAKLRKCSTHKYQAVLFSKAGLGWYCGSLYTLRPTVRDWGQNEPAMLQTIRACLQRKPDATTGQIALNILAGHHWASAIESPALTNYSKPQGQTLLPLPALEEPC